MKKSIVNILRKVVAVVILLIIGYFAVAFYGSPVSQLICKNSAEKYVEENYPGYYVKKCGYNFKNGNYYATIDMENKMDARFNINMDWWGNVKYDSYDFYVKSKINTYTRMKTEYNKLVEDAIGQPDYNVTLIGGDILQTSDYEAAVGPIENPDKIMMPFEDVIPEKIFDYGALGEKYGSVYVWAEEKDVSYANAARIMLDVKNRLDNAGVKTYYVNLYLRQPKTEDGYVDLEGIQFSGFRFSDIYPEGLEERIETAHKERTAYFARMDAQK